MLKYAVLEKLQGFIKQVIYRVNSNFCVVPTAYLLRVFHVTGDGGFIPSTQLYYRRLFLLLNTT
jgi:hypothetical protein